MTEKARAPFYYLFLKGNLFIFVLKQKYNEMFSFLTDLADGVQNIFNYALILFKSNTKVHFSVIYEESLTFITQ